ncbi:MAG: excinuclease ABC subunit C [Candidatus Doudnabacteria bacterium CG10_big_fil_rev_8_21_14_0_10_42_18]|uniref:Excinuclease ABC subunit C n=1 Tax=Candidatus Doudnabacteria bacterium CG10_big_fil_rev_8_21_14_0_10_42_18 TaxID=1974552 RepID=A0A2H0VAB3_9BACT|nr:MAG: excinuclease ABC subunit C [Candidatus Doudnabacteria bacterium CG10_big_fil_rev_8_21_14_0_10_42_18]
MLCIDNKRKSYKFYIGLTQDLKKRYAKHQDREVKTTRIYDKQVLIYYEASLNKTDARKRELQLKSGFGRGYLNRRLESYLKTVMRS